MHTVWLPTAGALLEFTEAPLRIMRVPSVVDIGIITTSPALDVAACARARGRRRSSLSQSFQTPLPATSCQLTASSPLQNDSPLARSMSLHHSLTDLRDNNLTCCIIVLYFPWLQATYQASLRFCQRANLVIKQVEDVFTCSCSRPP